jgi:glycosyltransferase involved in cell wall biosynthesis
VAPPTATAAPPKNSTGYRHIAVGQSDTPPIAAKRILQALHEYKVKLIINNDNPYLQAIAPWVDCPFISVGHMSRTSVARLACHNRDWVDYVVAISTDMQHRFVDKFDLEPFRVPVIYNGVSDPLGGVLPTRDSRHNLHAVYAGGSGRNKGADLLEDAVTREPLPENMTLHWFGHMSEQDHQRLSHLPGVVVYGRTPRQKFLQVLAQADIFLLPSRTEGCPMAMLEAMSYGVVPVASNGIGAMQRIIIHGQEGFICRLSEWRHDMHSCIYQFIRNPTQLAEMRQRTYRRFQTDFTIDTTVDRLLALGTIPICKRAQKPARLRLLRWHRPFLPNSLKAPLLDRLAIRTGYLRQAGIYNYDSLSATYNVTSTARHT